VGCPTTLTVFCCPSWRPYRLVLLACGLSLCPHPQLLVVASSASSCRLYWRLAALLPTVGCNRYFSDSTPSSLHRSTLLCYYLFSQLLCTLLHGCLFCYSLCDQLAETGSWLLPCRLPLQPFDPHRIIYSLNQRPLASSLRPTPAYCLPTVPHESFPIACNLCVIFWVNSPRKTPKGKPLLC
jgi:hypothetical protein